MVSVTAVIRSCYFRACFGLVPQRIAQRHLGGIGPQLCILFLAFGAGAFFGDLAAKRDVNRNLLVAHRLHGFFARHRFFDVGREFFLFFLFALDLARPEFRHHVFGEQLQSLADVLVLVAAALLDEDGLVDAGLLEVPQMGPQLLRRADAVIGAGRRQRVSRFFEIGPDVGAAGLVLAEDIVMRQAVAEKPQAVLAAAARFHLVGMHGEAGHHRDIWD